MVIMNYFMPFRRNCFSCGLTNRKKEPWSLRNVLIIINSNLKRIRYPVTCRIPRSILKWSRLKANESRILLLMAYPIFKNYLPENNYHHLQKLAFGMNIGESSSISARQLEGMDILLNSFVDDFPYDPRYVVQTVHRGKTFCTNGERFRTTIELQHVQF